MRTRILCLTAISLLVGCATANYAFWEKFGYEKRDILVSRVVKARDEQSKAKEEFKTTFQKFQELTNYQGGELESKYNKLNSAYEDCKGRADAVKDRIAKVDSVANDMFKEWNEELKKYENAEYRRKSAEQLQQTKQRYSQLIAVMRQSESKMEPVLRAFNDQVLFLKHNLNAQAIASLQTTAAGIDQDVQRLIKDMEASINEANDFISQMKSPS